MVENKKQKKKTKTSEFSIINHEMMVDGDRTLCCLSSSGVALGDVPFPPAHLRW